MDNPKITRPTFPPGYVDNPTETLTWEYIVQRLSESKHYWLSTARPNGRPHVVPRWGVFLDGRFYYDGSPETRHARNLEHNPAVALHLESGEQALIAEGESHAAAKPTPELAQRLAEALGAKYGEMGYAPTPDQWDEGGLFVFTPRQVIAWTSFTQNPTKFVLG